MDTLGHKSGTSAWTRAATVAALGLCFGLSGAQPALAQEKGKLGFVVMDWFSTMYTTKYMDECPEGLTHTNDELWWRGLSKEMRAKMTGNGLIQALARAQPALQRGPNGEDVCFNPTIVKDPPMRTAQGKWSYGANLDGTLDGKATAKSCAHEKYTGVDGTPGVDNQLYRILGCAYGWRKQTGRHVDDNANEARRTSGLAMILIEVTGVDDPRNDDDVKVTFYRSIDQYPLNSAGQPLPYASYRIQEKPDGTPMFGDSIKGKIKNNILTTDRGDVAMPFYGNYTYMHPVIKYMDLRLEIADDGLSAKGMVTGYYDAERYLYYLLGQGGAATIHGDSCPALYDAFNKYADGYPDPKTGKCTHISSAFDLTAFPAFVVKPHELSKQRQASR